MGVCWIVWTASRRQRRYSPWPCWPAAGWVAETMQSLTLLGSTGSIGASTLDVISRHPDRYQLFALTANRQWQALADQCLRYKPRYAALQDLDSARLLRSVLRERGSTTQVLEGETALVELASAPEVDTVMAAIVGAAGLLPSL